MRRAKPSTKENPFDRLVEDLCTGVLSIRMLDQAVMVYIQKSPVLPEGVKNLLAQKGGGGLVRDHFHLITQIIGNIELAYMRDAQHGLDKKPKKSANEKRSA